MRGDILVVDDEPGPRESLRMILKQDHNVRTADSGSAALREIERQKPDLVLLDLRMPDMDGTAVLTEVKSKYPEVEVAIITAYAAVESARLAVRYGAVDYLTKPYSTADVERIVEKALNSRRREHDAAVLAAQLTKLTETLLGRAGSIGAQHRAGVADALDSLESVQSDLHEDLESVRGLGEMGEMAASVTHDINNLLTIVLTSAQSLLAQLDAGDSERVADITPQVARIARAAEDCSTMIRRIKDFVRVNVNYQPSPIDVNEIMSSAVALMRDADSGARRQVEYRVRCGSVPTIYGDEVALRTVLLNLLENSLDALAGQGFVELSSEAHDGWVRICVRDNGCGMSPQVLAQATQAFFTAHKSSGTGLGLSTAERVVRRHQGRLSIESEEGKGTAVTIELPVRQRPHLADIPEATEPAAQRGGSLIVADDDHTIRDLMAAVLEAEGYCVLRASDGREAWSLFENAYDGADSKRLMLVLDHEMPGMTGRELTSRVKAVDPQIPVLIVSGYISSDDGGPEDALIGKPFDIRDLVESVRNLMAGLPA